MTVKEIEEYHLSLDEAQENFCLRCIQSSEELTERIRVLMIIISNETGINIIRNNKSLLTDIDLLYNQMQKCLNAKSNTIAMWDIKHKSI